MRVYNGKLIFLIYLFFLLSCKTENLEKTLYGDIGDIRYNSKIDDPSFKVCHEDLSIQFNYNGIGLVYDGEKPALVRHFKENYKFKKIVGQTGYIIIRFIINCEGKAGRYRVSEMGLDLVEKKFDKEIRNNILKATKQTTGWVVHIYEGNTYDYYQYLVFKIKDAQLIDILP